MRKKIVCYIHKHTKKAVRVSTTRVSRYSPGSISLFVVTIEFTNASKYTYTHYLHYKSFLDMKVAPERTNTRSRTVIIFNGEKLSYPQRSAKTRPLPTAPWLDSRLMPSWYLSLSICSFLLIVAYFLDVGLTVPPALLWIRRISLAFCVSLEILLTV